MLTPYSTRSSTGIGLAGGVGAGAGLILVATARDVERQSAVASAASRASITSSSRPVTSATSVSRGERPRRADSAREAFVTFSARCGRRGTWTVRLGEGGA